MPAVLITLMVASILTFATISTVGFEGKHAIVDEQQTKGYYLARSAVDTMSDSIMAEVNALKNLEAELRAANLSFNEYIDTGSGNIYSTLMAAKENEYTAQQDKLEGHVLPIAGSIGTTFTHTISGIGSSDVIVAVKKTSSEKYELSSTVSVNGHSGHAAKILTVPINNENVLWTHHTSVTAYVPNTVTTYETIPNDSSALFENAIYSFGDLELGNNYKLVKGNTSAASKAKHRGTASLGGGKNFGTIEPDTATTPPIPPASLLPIDISQDTRFTSIISDTLPAVITAGSMGYYGPDIEASSITVNTGTGTGENRGFVIIKANHMLLKNNVTFTVTGTGFFYLYIYDMNLSDGGVSTNTSSNNFQITGVSGEARTFILIDQPATDQTISANKVEIKNGATFFAYVYAPYCFVDFMNNGEITGSIVGGQVKIKNNLTIHQTSPSAPWYDGDGSGGTVVTHVTSTLEAVTTTSEHLEGTYGIKVYPGTVVQSWKR